MWSDTQISKRLGIAYPILQGPLGSGLSSVSLAAVVSRAGGLGCYGANTLAPAQIKDVAAQIRTHTDKPFALHLWVDQDQDAAPTLDRERFERSGPGSCRITASSQLRRPCFRNRSGKTTGRRSKPFSPHGHTCSLSLSEYLPRRFLRSAAVAAL